MLAVWEEKAKKFLTPGEDAGGLAEEFEKKV
jgi:hypothetical protein